MARKGSSGGGRRRGKGDGSIYYHERRQRWIGLLTLPDGRRKQFSAATRPEVASKLIQAQHDVQRGLPVVAEKQTAAQYLRDWLETMRPPRLARNTWVYYHNAIELHFIPAIGDVVLARLSAQQLQRAYADMLRDGLAASTVQVYHVVLHAALDAAVRQDVLPRNVAELVEVPRRAKSEMRVWNAEQTRQFLDSVRGDPDEALYVVALTTGMRESELLGTLWRNVDLEDGSLRVLTQLLRRADLDSGYELTAPKTTAGRRRIALSRVALDALRAHRTRQAEHKREAASAYVDLGLVFPTEAGTPLHAGAARSRFKSRRRRAGVPFIRFHDMRHTCATLMLSRGVNVKVVSEMLGHSSPLITMAVYAHVLPDMQKEATSAMDTLLGLPARAAVTVDAPVVREVADEDDE